MKRSRTGLHESHGTGHPLGMDMTLTPVDEGVETCLDCGFHGTPAGHLWSGCLKQPVARAA